MRRPEVNTSTVSSGNRVRKTPYPLAAAPAGYDLLAERAAARASEGLP
jgi:hypothetical protein